MDYIVNEEECQGCRFKPESEPDCRNPEMTDEAYVEMKDGAGFKDCPFRGTRAAAE